jgi:hypothetical protein
MSLKRVEAITQMPYQVFKPGLIRLLPPHRYPTPMMSDTTSGSPMGLIPVLASNIVMVIRQRHRIRMPGEQRRAQFNFRISFALLAMLQM